MQFHDEDGGKNAETRLKHKVFHVLIHSVIGGLTILNKATRDIKNCFTFLWQYRRLAR